MAGQPAASDAPVAERGLRVAVAAFRHRNFALFWSGALISNVGTWMQNITVPYVLYEMTGRASLVGLAAFMQFTPVVFVGPLGGSLADRYPRRSLLIGTQLALAVVAAALWAVWIADVATPALLIALVAVTGLVAGLNIPAWQAFVSELVPREELLGAVTLNSAQFNLSRAIGPAIGGIVLASLGAGWAFLLNAVSFSAVIAALLLVRVPALPRAESTDRVMRQFAEGLRYVRSQPALGACVVIVSAVAGLGMPVLQLASVFASDVFDIGADGYGLLTGALGVGGALAAPVVTGWAGGIRRSRLAGGALFAYGFTLIAFAQAPGFPTALVAIAFTGAAFLVVVSTLSTTVQLLVTEELRGRVMAIYIMGFTAAYPVGALVQGWIADRVGAPATVTGAGIVLAIIAAWLVSRRALLERLDRDDPMPPPDVPESEPAVL